MPKKGKTKSWKKQKVEQAIEKPFEPDLLTHGTRIGMVIIGYVLFIIGSLSALIIAYAGRHKRGASEVIIIGWTLLLAHTLFFSLIIINPAQQGIQPMKNVLTALIIYPFIPLLIGILSFKAWWGITFRTIGLALVIPHYIVLLIINPSVLWDKTRENEILARSNVRLIANALESYAAKHDGDYPSHTETLLVENIIDTIPMNPFQTVPKPMIQIAFGMTPFEGNFTYVPVSVDSRIAAYYLVGYGSVGTPGEDVNEDGTPDHVIIVQNGIGYPKSMTTVQYNLLLTQLKPLKELLYKGD